MLENELLLEQRQVLTARQLQSLEILTFTNQELNAFLTNEYLENPLLEDPGERKDDTLKELEQVYEKGITYREQYIQYGEEECSRKEDLKAPDSDELEMQLLGQLDIKCYSSIEWKMLRYLVKCLDDRGFFIYETEEIARAAKVPEPIVKYCLDQLKTLEPAGIFAKDVPECLTIQLKRMGVQDENIYNIVEFYFPALLLGQVGIISRGLNVSTMKVKEAINQISRLNPKPLMNGCSEAFSYIVPDLLVRYEKGTWDVQINDKWMGECRYNDYYMQMMTQTEDEELRLYFREKMERARFVVNCIEQRRRTLTRIVEVILDYQRDYFLYGGYLKPMSMEDVAQMIGIHVSTISRAVKDKYMQFQKLYLIRDLFTSSVSAQGDMSASSVKEKIQSCILEENTRAPLSDSKIAEMLNDMGIEISRRTVAKYRIQMGIPESRHRMHLEKRV